MSELCGSVPLCHMLETGPLVGGTSFKSELCGDVKLEVKLVGEDVVLGAGGIVSFFFGPQVRVALALEPRRCFL